MSFQEYFCYYILFIYCNRFNFSQHIFLQFKKNLLHTCFAILTVKYGVVLNSLIQENIEILKTLPYSRNIQKTIM